MYVKGTWATAFAAGNTFLDGATVQLGATLSSCQYCLDSVVFFVLRSAIFFSLDSWVDSTGVQFSNLIFETTEIK